MPEEIFVNQAILLSEEIFVNQAILFSEQIFAIFDFNIPDNICDF